MEIESEVSVKNLQRRSSETATSYMQKGLHHKIEVAMPDKTYLPLKLEQPKQKL